MAMLSGRLDLNGLPGAGKRRPYEKWSVSWFSGRSEESRRTDRQSGRSGIWPHYPGGLGTWADRIGARKFKLRHYPNVAIAEHRAAMDYQADGTRITASLKHGPPGRN